VTLLLIYSLLIGMVVGSFLNVVIYRVPLKLSIIRPRSACPQCRHPIAERDNIPVLSWIILRGRCRHCHSPISVRYPLVEASTGVLFALTAWRIGPHFDLGVFLVLDGSLIALALIDLEHLLLPRSIVYPTLGAVIGWLVASAAYYDQWHRLQIAAVCGAAWFIVFWLLNFFSPRSLGYGDVRLSLVLGIALGWLGVGDVLIGFFAANLLGAIIGLTLIGFKKMSRDQPIPYGVYLAAGATLAVLIGPVLLVHWHNWPNAH